MTEKGHELPFTVPRKQVCNALLGRHSRSQVGKRPFAAPVLDDRNADIADIGPAWVSVMKKGLAETHGSL
jgi:hypothetical protein